MLIIIYFAKSKPRETLEAHIDSIVEEYERLTTIYPNVLSKRHLSLLKEASIYHDMGKINTAFQHKITSRTSLPFDPSEIPHGFLSPAFFPFKHYISERGYTEEDIRLLVQVVYHHHQRRDRTSKEVAEEIKRDLVPKYASLTLRHIRKDGLTDKYLSYRHREQLLDTDDKRDFYLKYVLLKGLFNKIDYAASGHFEVELAPENVGERTEGFIKTLPNSTGLNDMQRYMKDNQHNSVVVTASTGIGKTEGALIWIGNDKGIFSLPLTTSINAMYSRLITKMDFERVGIVHANMLGQLIKEREKEDGDAVLNLYSKMKQFGMPLTVSTIDQFVDFIFGYEGSEAKYATFKYSKLIIDEIQMYQPKLIGYLLIALSKIQKIGGQFAIITATLPPVIEHFMKQLSIAYKKPEEPFLKQNKHGNVITRHFVQTFRETLSMTHLRRHIDSEKKNLIIVNTINQAQELYQLCKKQYGDKVKLLHSRFIKTDRAEKEEAIIKLGRLDNKDTGIWITTSLVEASVDIDFDILITELTEISGLLQRMGRVYRNRDYEKQEPNVFIYSGKPYPSGISERMSIVDLTLFERSRKALEGIGTTFLSEKDKMDMVDDVYDPESLKDSEYYQTIRDTIRDFENIIPFEIEKRNIDLRGIDAEAVIPLSVYKENEKTILECVRLFKSSVNPLDRIEAKSKIGDYTVNVPSYRIKKLKDTEHLQLSSRFAIPIVNYAYSKELGLRYTVDKEEDIHY